MNPFSDPQAVARYAEGPPRLVPGFADLQRMALLLLRERTPDDARVLVIGAGGGLELKVFAEAQPRWQLDGVDPSAEMLKLAEATLGPLAPRAKLIEGTIDAVPRSPTYDAAACLLTLHFIAEDERRRTLLEIHRRLKPGAPFVAAHLSIPQSEPERALWLSRYAAFAISSGIEPDKANAMQGWVAAQVPILAPEQDEALLRDAGFSDIGLFYASLAFRGWVAYA